MKAPARLAIPGSGTGKSPSWISGSASLSDVVLSTRARLARNVSGAIFPHMASDADLARVAKIVLTAAHRVQEKAFRSMHTVDISALNDQEKAALVDSHLTSVAHVRAGKHRFALVDDNQSVSVLINEEDHIRIQVILPGMQADAARRKADAIDDALSQELPIAYDKHLGYLTASLANCGMGLRVSIMVHLPALALLHRLPSTWQAANSLDAAVRGLYGEGTEMAGNIYQVSNAVSMGWTEAQTVGKITAVATYLEAEEAGARELLIRTRAAEMEDLVQNAQHQLRDAERLSVEEGVRILSTLRFGYLMGYDTHVSDTVFSELVAGLRGGTQLIASDDDRARDVFYQETRRPALFRNRIRAERSTVAAG
ncbi:MAG: hypothetical protein P4L33_20060 [Capsulimonadaceae bacterium]|nr:hypothetical protein [Capsulimonadaceae bacterium]